MKFISTRHLPQYLLCVAAISAMSVSAIRAADEPAAGTSVVATAITRPSIERKLTFAVPGLVSSVAVKEGDQIKQGQILAAQDTRENEFTLKSDEREANSSEKINYSKDDLAMKQVTLKRKQYLFDHDRAAAQSEVEEADLAVKLASAQIALAELEHDQKGYDAEKQRVVIELGHITSPINGIVEKINIGEGEMADPQNRDGSIVVGQWNPLWLEMHLPTAQATQLKLNQELPVKYDGGQWQTAKIIFFEKADAASDTIMVRMELANPQNVTPGLHMQVKLPENITAVANGQ